jgi:Domain of unknown function (DUF4260)
LNHPNPCQFAKLRLGLTTLLGGTKRITMIHPKLLLHIEGAAVLLASCILYQQAHGSWLWFGLLFLIPDFSMLGYLANKKVGAAVYNLGHTYASPLLLFSVLCLSGQTSYGWIVLIWVAHIGFDRTMGYGLKYETAFKDTHFQRV